MSVPCSNYVISVETYDLFQPIFDKLHDQDLHALSIEDCFYLAFCFKAKAPQFFNQKEERQWKTLTASNIHLSVIQCLNEIVEDAGFRLEHCTDLRFSRDSSVMYITVMDGIQPYDSFSLPDYKGGRTC